MSKHKELEHKPIETFNLKSLVWTTQFNDLRVPTSLGATPEEKHRRTLLELKTLALLLPRVLIRDADLVNHMILQDIIRRDVDGISQALVDRFIVFGLRTWAEDFSQMNEQSGIERAFPDRYEFAKESLGVIDAIFRRKNISVADIALSEAASRFEDNLMRILSGNVLTDPDANLLRETIERTRERHPERSMIHFGDMYQYMVTDQNQNPYGDVVQWCRAAHALVHPADISFAPSASNRDLQHYMVTFLLNHSGAVIEEPHRLFDLYPRRILSDLVLERMSFPEIKLLRRKGFEIGYFAAATNLQEKINSPDFEREYIGYLRSLGEYLELIGKELSVELTDWQTALLKRVVSVDKQDRSTLAWGIPITISALFAITTWSPVPLVIGGVVAAGLDRASTLIQARKPDPLSKLLNGLNVTPPTR